MEHNYLPVYIVTLLLFLIFAAFYIKDRRKIINGFLFNLFLFSASISLLVGAIETNNRILWLIVIFFEIIFGGILLFGVSTVIILSFVNAHIVIRREGRKLPNLLTLFLGIGLLVMVLLPIVLDLLTLPHWLLATISIFYLVIYYFIFVFINYLVASAIYQLYSPRLNKDYIIVLGSGLKDGYIVTPLLAARIDKAIAFYHRQSVKRKPPKLIFSGGQGDDELIAEGAAMKKYALEKGIPEEDVLVEDRSTNTFENMLFSKQIMDCDTKGKYRCLFSTNTFHLLRAGIYAKQAMLDAHGIGAKTAVYFLPNAVLREFIAIIVIHRKWHSIFIGLVVTGFLIVELL